MATPVRLLERFRADGIAIIIASVACVIALLSLLVSGLVSVMAWDDAKEARVKTESQDERIAQLEALVEKEISLESNRKLRLETWLKSKGVPLEEIYDDE